MSKDTTFSEFSVKMRTFRRPAVLGILNVTPDSFYDGGRYEGEEKMLARARQIVDEGADILDLGAASTRPGSVYPSEEEELARLMPALRLVRKELPGVIISVDTCSPQVARRAVEEGADWVNDVSGGSEEMFQAVAELGVPYILTHTLAPNRSRIGGEMGGACPRSALAVLSQCSRSALAPDAAELRDHDGGIIQPMAFYFSERLERLYSLGATDVILDPGFGFGKTLEENYALLGALSDLRMLFPEEPLLVGVSRKSMIYKPLGLTPQEALPGSLALAQEALRGGAQILRVHDVKETLQTIQIHELISNTRTPID